MSTKKILINRVQGVNGLLRVARIDGQRLEDLEIESGEKQPKVDRIYNGEVVSIQPSLEAAFVNFGSDKERNGFLPLKEIAPEYYPKHTKDSNLSIKDVLFEGQKILVQVNKEERGTKGAALSSFITLAGSYLVLIPNNPKAGGISRRIEGNERDELKQILSKLTIPEGMGVIIRTAGMGKSTEELQWDLDVLINLWHAIKEASDVHGAPYLIHQDNDIVTRTLRDHLRADTEEVLIDDKETYEQVVAFVERVRPDFVSRVKFYDDATPLFTRYQVESQIESAYQRKVRLPSGGEIVIDRSEALTAIDVNSAQSKKGGDIEETARHTNVEAAREVARQLRLRDIGGLIVIDFIDMEIDRNRREVEDVLQEALSDDRARTQIARISRFGLLEMSRQCLRSSLGAANMITCPRCHGEGNIRNVKSQALFIIHLVEDSILKENSKKLQVQVPVDIATYLLNEQHQALSEMQSLHDVTVIIVPNPYMQTPQYEISPLGKSEKESASYELLSMPKVYYAQQDIEAMASRPLEPAVKNVLPSTAAPIAQRKRFAWLRKLFAILFSSSSKTSEKTRSHSRSHQSNHRSGRRHSNDRNLRQRSSQRSRGGSRRPRPESRERPQETSSERGSRNESRHSRRDSEADTNKRRQSSRRSGGGNRRPARSNPRGENAYHAPRSQNTPYPEEEKITKPSEPIKTEQAFPEEMPTPSHTQAPQKVIESFPEFNDTDTSKEAEKWEMVETKKASRDDDNRGNR